MESESDNSVLLARISTGVKPTEVTTKVSLGEALILKNPASSVFTARFVPLTDTVAAEIGFPFSSVTFPVTVLCCANANTPKSNKLVKVLITFS